MTKTVLITGGAGGIGREFCKLFARDGYSVIVFSLLQTELDDLGAQLQREFPQCRYYPVQMDLSAPDAAKRVHAWLNERGIALDVLVNNVGFGLFGDHVDLDSDRLANMLTVNNIVMTQLCALIGKDMKARGAGKILNVASLAGFTSMPYFAAYSASKSYVISFSISLARELKEFGVQVTCLCPSTTNTGFLDTAQGKGNASKGIMRFVSKTVATPAEVASVGYKALKKGKGVVLPTPGLTLQSHYLRMMPPSFMAWFVYKESHKDA